VEPHPVLLVVRDEERLLTLLRVAGPRPVPESGLDLVLGRPDDLAPTVSRTPGAARSAVARICAPVPRCMAKVRIASPARR
jgi:hypothetical protein